jgi:hypothetical protein
MADGEGGGAQFGPPLHVEHRLLPNSVDRDRARLTTTPDASATASGSTLNRRNGSVLTGADEQSLRAVIAADEAVLNHSPTDSDAVASALKRLLVCLEPMTSGSWTRG